MTNDPWGSSSNNSNSPSNKLNDLKKLLNNQGPSFKTPDPSLKGIFWAGLVLLVLVFIFNALFLVRPTEQAIVTRFGKFVRVNDSGLHFIAWPIEKVSIIDVTSLNKIELGSDKQDRAKGTSPMLTGDENIVDIAFTVLWRVNVEKSPLTAARDYYYNVMDPVETVRSASESAMRDVVAKMDIQTILTSGRDIIAQEVKKNTQAILDSYNAGISINQINLQQVEPPVQVIDSFRDVQSARADQERLSNEADAYANKIIPEARGQAEILRQEAQGYKASVVANAKGEASRFDKVYSEYVKSKTVMKERLYLETMERVLKEKQKVVVEPNATNLLPLLQQPKPTSENK